MTDLVAVFKTWQVFQIHYYRWPTSASRADRAPISLITRSWNSDHVRVADTLEGGKLQVSRLDLELSFI